MKWYNRLKWLLLLIVRADPALTNAYRGRIMQISAI